AVVDWMLLGYRGDDDYGVGAGVEMHNFDGDVEGAEGDFAVGAGAAAGTSESCGEEFSGETNGGAGGSPGVEVSAAPTGDVVASWQWVDFQLRATSCQFLVAGLWELRVLQTCLLQNR